jgi:diguanylate cyclase (GGDEF)-like protein
VALAFFVAGARLFVSGADARPLVRWAAPVGLVLSFVTGTNNGRLGELALMHGPLMVASYAYGALLFATLPASRRSVGSRLTASTLLALGALWTGLVLFHLSARLNTSLSALPWFVRLERYGFYADLLLQLALAYAMVRLLVEDGEREAVDTRSHLDLLRDRQRKAEFYDEPTGLLNRRAYDMSIGLDFSRASFGSVARLRLANLEETIAAQGHAIGDMLLRHFAGLLGSSVRTHDRVYRWNNRDFLVVMPRAVPDDAGARMRELAERSAPLIVPSVRDALRADVKLAVAPFRGGEELGRTVSAVTADSEPPQPS